MTDLVERLRRTEEGEGWQGNCRPVALVNPDGPEAASELERMRREVEALRVLSFSGNALVQIVEGVQGSMEHGTWRDEKGMRLKDTNAWALFYTTFKASAQAAKSEETGR